MDNPPKSLLFAAFAAIYVIWGSTYLAIQIAIESSPPLLMAGFRFLISGLVVWAVFFVWRAPKTSLKDWRDAAVVGCLLLSLGNGGVTFGEQWLPSSATALLIATVPLWVAILGWATGVSSKPSFPVWMGLGLGLGGICLLFNPFNHSLSSSDRKGFYSVMIAALSWTAGSLYSRKAVSTLPVFLKVGMQMICGGLLLTLVGALTGELQNFHPYAISRRSLAAFVFLILFGSWLGFTAYVWLLQVCHPARVATYAFVNPVVAVLLGWGLAGEPLRLRTMAAAAVIVCGVCLVVFSSPAPPSKPALVPGD